MISHIHKMLLFMTMAKVYTILVVFLEIFVVMGFNIKVGFLDYDNRKYTRGPTVYEAIANFTATGALTEHNIR